MPDILPILERMYVSISIVPTKRHKHEHGTLIWLSRADSAGGGAWQSLWFGEGKDWQCCQAPFSDNVAQDGEDEPPAAKCGGVGTYGGGGSDRKAHQPPEDAEEEGERIEDSSGVERARSNEHSGVCRGGSTLAVADDGNGDGEQAGRNYSNAATDSVENVKNVSSSSSSPRVPRKKRPCTVDGGSCFTSDALSGGTRGASPAPGLQRPQGRCEPLTPRSTKRVLSPFWIPPLQEPPPSLTGPPKLAEGRPRGGMQTPRGTGSDGDFRRENSLGVESGDEKSSQALVCGGGGGWAGVEKRGAPSEFSAMLGQAPDERVRQNMLHAQEIRDRYLRYVFFFLRSLQVCCICFL